MPKVTEERSEKKEARRNMEAPFSCLLPLLYFCTLLSVPAYSENVGRRALMGFKETPNGSNQTFECSPSGPCVPCLYSEKKDDQYRCSETGYRIPLKCVEVQEDPKSGNGQKTKKHRSSLEILLGNPDSMNRRILEENTSQEGYITYRSCIPAVPEEKMSVVSFEATILCLLFISGSGVYLRRKRTAAATAGVASGRSLNNSRF